MLLENEIKKIKKMGGNGFIAENRIYGKKIHLLKCPICHKDNHAHAPRGQCGWCGFIINKDVHHE